MGSSAPPIARVLTSLGVLAGLATFAAHAQIPAPAELTLTGMTYASSRGDANEVVVEAAQARVLLGEERVDLEGVSARLGSLEDAHAGGMELACERGVLILGDRSFRGEGAVVGRTADGREFRTERMDYRHDRGLASSDDSVWIRDAAGSYRGGGFRYWVRENRFRLLGGAAVVQGAR